MSESVAGDTFRYVGRRLVVAFLLLCFVPACASTRPPESPHEQLLNEIRRRGLDPNEIVLPFEPDDEMRAWVRDRIMSLGEPERRLEQLLDAILHRDGKQLKYERGFTATAREVWQMNRANCLSFTHLYVGLAREVGLPVYYLRVYDLQNFERDGDLVVASGHVTAAWGPPTKRRVVDFTDQPLGVYHETEPISDITAIALYYSNLGAQRILEGHLDEARSLLDTAIRLDPELADAWANQGVVLRRLGNVPAAENAFRKALEVNPGLLAPYENLAVLLEGEGRSEEAKDLLELTDRRGNRNPYAYLALGDLSLKEGRPEEAARFYRRAERLHPHHAEPLAALGQSAFAAGHRKEAERYLKKALRINSSDERTVELAESLHRRSDTR